jgi:hypothetical protein
MHALDTFGLLKPGTKGLGFGCGEEVLVPAFANVGIEVTATDQAFEAAKDAGWVNGQHASGLASFARHIPRVCSQETFDKNVTFMVADMNNINYAELGIEQYDFMWSVCAMEHLGSIDKCFDFVVKAMSLLKKGGKAIHTTEMNFLDERYVENESTCVFNKTQILHLFQRLKAAGYSPYPLLVDTGTGFHDGHIDIPPYYSDTPETVGNKTRPSRSHLKLLVSGVPSTCLGIVVCKL